MTVSVDQAEDRFRSARSTLIPGLERYFELLDRQAALNRMVAAAGAAFASSVSNVLLAQTATLAGSATGNAERAPRTAPTRSEPDGDAARATTNGSITEAARSAGPVQHSGSHHASVDVVFDELVQFLIAAEISDDLVATTRS